MGVNPVDTFKLYDCIVLAGKRSPGVCKLNAPKRSLGWDKQKAKGDDGASVVNNGAELCEFQATLTLWKDPDRDEYAGWDAWKPILDTQVKDTDKKALDIYHPQLVAIGVTGVVVKSYTAPQPDGKGGATVHIDFIEFKPKKKKTGDGKPLGATDNSALAGAIAGAQSTEGEQKLRKAKELRAKANEQQRSGDRAGALSTRAELDNL